MPLVITDSRHLVPLPQAYPGARLAPMWVNSHQGTPIPASQRGSKTNHSPFSERRKCAAKLRWPPAVVITTAAAPPAWSTPTYSSSTFLRRIQDVDRYPSSHALMSSACRYRSHACWSQICPHRYLKTDFRRASGTLGCSRRPAGSIVVATRLASEDTSQNCRSTLELTQATAPSATTSVAMRVPRRMSISWHRAQCR